MSGARMRGTAVAVAMALATTPVIAVTFESVRYDPNNDQLVVTLIYDGTNPDHHFSVEWGNCLKLDQPGAPAHQLNVDILDDQGNDATEKTYRKTVTVSLASLPCRPARVTLSTTPPVYWNRKTLDIPQRVGLP